MDKIRLLYLLNWKISSGADTQAHLLIQYLAKRKEIDLSLLSSTPVDMDKTVVETETKYNVPLYICRNVTDAIFELSPDIVFIHSYAPYIIRSVADLKERGFRGKIAYRNGTNLLEQYFIYPYIGKPELVLYPTIMWHEFDLIICPSRFIVEQVSYYLPDVKKLPKLAYIPAAVETKSFIPSPNFNYCIITSARLEITNPVLITIQAFRRLVSEFPQLEMKIFGGGVYRKLYEHLVERYGLSNKVRLYGWVEQEIVLRELEKADIFVFPTLTQNGVPVAVLEAMAAGCACVVADTLAMREVESLIRVPVEDVTAWYKIIRQLVADEGFRKDVIKRQLEEVKEYDVEKIVEVYVDVFKKLLEEG